MLLFMVGEAMVAGRAGYALAHGAFTIINGIATGQGGACGVGLRLVASFELTPRPGTVEFQALNGTRGRVDDRLARACGRALLELVEATGELGARIETASEIPTSRGLKSSSAAANAILLAGTAALGAEMEPLEVVQMGVDAAIEAGVTLTGAFDDAVATMFGGAVLTDNARRSIVSWPDVPTGLEVLFLVPERKIEKSSLRREDFGPAREKVGRAFNLASGGDIAGAITLNGRAYAPLVGVDNAPADAALAAGAWAAGMTGTGPAIAVLVTAQTREAVLAALAPFSGRDISTRPNLSPASVLSKEGYARQVHEITGGKVHD